MKLKLKINGEATLIFEAEGDAITVVNENETPIEAVGPIGFQAGAKEEKYEEPGDEPEPIIAKKQVPKKGANTPLHPEEYKTELGLRIMGERIRQGISKKKFSKMAGISTVTLAGVEKGEVKPRGTTLQAIADALEVDVAYLEGAQEERRQGDENEA